MKWEFARHYTALVAEADRVGWPTVFRADLTEHDRMSLGKRDPKLPFAWILRETGTHLALPRAPEERHAGKGSSRYATMVAEAFGAERCRFYFWDGTALVPCRTAEELDDRMRGVEQAVVTPFGRSRAEEIWAARRPFGDLSAALTPGEDAYVKQIWDTLPGTSCWMDAFYAILQGRREP